VKALFAAGVPARWDHGQARAADKVLGLQLSAQRPDRPKAVRCGLRGGVPPRA
jgi:hypothetical protein